jgi:hypothetical protein
MRRFFVSAFAGLLALAVTSSPSDAQRVRVAVGVRIPHGSVSVEFGRRAYPLRAGYVVVAPARVRAHAKARRQAERAYRKAVRRAERAYDRTFRAYAWDPVRARYEAERAYWRVLWNAGYRFDRGHRFDRDDWFDDGYRDREDRRHRR